LDSPLARLKALADQSAAQDSLQLVLVTAAEGAGRTHLLAQLAASRPNTHVVQCTPGGTLGRVLRALTGAPASDAPAIVAALMTAPALVALDPERRPLVAQLLASLLAAPIPGSATAGLDASSRSEGARAQLIHVVSFAAATAPLVLAIDDAHLADAQAVAFFDALAHVDTPVPALIVFTADASPEFADSAFLQHPRRWPERRRGAPIAIPPVEGPALDALLQQRGAPAVLAARLAAVVEGNPSLAIGVWSALQRNPQLADKALPLTFDALRVESVRSEGAAIFALAQRASVLGETFLERALEATGPFDAALLASAVFQRVGNGPLGSVVGFADRRVGLALRAEVSSEQSAPWLEAAGEWAVSSLEALPEIFEPAAEHVLPLALPRIEGEEASLWQEAWAGWLSARDRADASFEALTAATRGSTGVRRSALIRRIADAQLLAGQPDKVLATLQSLTRAVPGVSLRPATAAGKALGAQPRSVLDRWESMTVDEASAAIEIVRAEACSHLVRKDDTVKAFGDLERRLERMKGPVAGHLWIRWAKSWGWFLCEILGRPADALLACEKVRRRVPAELLKDDAQALEFLRAQQMACATVGDFARALALVEELIALSRSRGDLRAQCLAWNARAILHFGQGELPGARRSFERSLDLARATGWKRREAIATHNLALVLLELGEFDSAQASEERYAVLSIAIGNHAATAEAPAVLAGVALARGDLPRADLLIAQARKAAEVNEWTMLLAWARALAGRLRVQKYAATRDSLELSKAKNDFLAALDLFEEHSTAWTEEVDPGEVYALYAAALKLAGQPGAAREALARGAKNLPVQNVVSLRALEVGRAFVEGAGMDAPLEWFESSGYQRLSRLWRQLAG
jgi:tetratricopeptide (TPR) repeat protein